MTATSGTIVIEAPSLEELLANFASRSKHLTRVQIERRFDDLLKHGYADARRDFDGQWRFRVRSRRARSSLSACGGSVRLCT
jgi:hypothetical protein